MNLRDKAFFIAELYHRNQLYGNHPYIMHLLAVENVLNRFLPEIGHQVMPNLVDRSGWDEALVKELQAAALLHDVLEDTYMTYQMLEATMGENVAQLVGAVTLQDDPIMYLTRKDKYRKAYPLIRIYPDATIIKLADRIANVEAGGKLDMYRKEHPEFCAQLHDHSGAQKGLDAMWTHLDELLKERH